LALPLHVVDNRNSFALGRIQTNPQRGSARASKLVGHSQIANKKLSAIADAVLKAVVRRIPTETISRSEVDRMLRDACLEGTR
jgi:hypothetical protein